MLHNLKYNNQIIYVIVFALVTILFLFNKGFISQYLNKDIFVNLSKYTYSLFLTHHVVIHSIKNGLWKTHSEFVYNHPIENILITLFIIFVIGIMTYHFVEKPAVKYLKEKWV